MDSDNEPISLEDYTVVRTLGGRLMLTWGLFALSMALCGLMLYVTSGSFAAFGFVAPVVVGAYAVVRAAVGRRALDHRFQAQSSS